MIEAGMISEGNDKHWLKAIMSKRCDRNWNDN
jgi:hypothetical protein